MSCWIGLGKLSSLYLYIIYSIIFKCLKDFILSFESIISGVDIGIFGISSELNKHILIKSLYKYIGFIIFSIIFFNYNKNKDEDKNNNSQSKTQNINNEEIKEKTTLIYVKQS